MTIDILLISYFMIGLYLGGIDTHREYVKGTMPSFLCFSWGVLGMGFFWPIAITVYLFTVADERQKTK